MHDNNEMERSMASGNGTVALVSRALFLVVLVVVIIVVIVVIDPGCAQAVVRSGSTVGATGNVHV